MNQIHMTRVLEKHGHTVQVVENGKKALERIHQEPFDLILMDIDMPIMDGTEATQRIRALDDPELSEIPIIALTAHAIRGDRERFMAHGMNEYVSNLWTSENFYQHT